MCVADPAEGAHDFHFVHTLLYVLHKLIFGASDAPPPLFFIFSLATCFLYRLFHKKANLLPIPRAEKAIHRLKSTMTCVKWGHLSPHSREWCSLLRCLISIYSKFPALKLTEEIQKGISGPVWEVKTKEHFMCAGVPVQHTVSVVKRLRILKQHTFCCI